MPSWMGEAADILSAAAISPAWCGAAANVQARASPASAAGNAPHCARMSGLALAWLWPGSGLAHLACTLCGKRRGLRALLIGRDGGFPPVPPPAAQSLEQRNGVGKT